MTIPQSVIDLIKEEQRKQCGRFIPEANAYIEKLEKHAELIIHTERGNTLGFVFFYCNAPDKHISYITLIATAREAQGMGIGQGLVQHVLWLAKSRGFSRCQLEVHKENKRALSFYQKIGFAVEEDRDSKYLMSIQIK